MFEAFWKWCLRPKQTWRNVVEAHRNGSKSDEEDSHWTKTRTAIHEFHILQLHVLTFKFPTFRLKSKIVLRRKGITIESHDSSFVSQEFNLSLSHCGLVATFSANRFAASSSIFCLAPSQKWIVWQNIPFKSGEHNPVSGKAFWASKPASLSQYWLVNRPFNFQKGKSPIKWGLNPLTNPTVEDFDHCSFPGRICSMPQSQTVFSHWHSPSPCKGSLRFKDSIFQSERHSANGFPHRTHL